MISSTSASLPENHLCIYQLVRLLSSGRTTVELFPAKRAGSFILLAAQKNPVPPEQICLLFWTIISKSHARRNLTRLLTHLRGGYPHQNR